MKAPLILWIPCLLFAGQLALNLQAKPKKKEGPKDAETNFEALWQNFHKRYAFFELRGVDWQKQYETFRPKVTKATTDEELFGILCEMLAPLKDGHVNLKARGGHKGKYNPEDEPQFYREFSSQQLVEELFQLTNKNLRKNGFLGFSDRIALYRYSLNNSTGYCFWNLPRSKLWLGQSNL